MTEDRKLVSVRFDDAELYRDLKFLAADRDLSMSELIVAALAEWRASQPRFIKSEPQATKAKRSVTKDPPAKAPRGAGKDK